MPTPEKHERMAFDNYPTPSWCVRRLIDAVPSIRDGGRLLEPTAGSGGIIRAAYDYGVRADWTAVELDERHAPRLDALAALPMTAMVYTGHDFLVWSGRYTQRERPIPFDLALGNPPYSIALEVVRACLRVSANVCMLLRAAFVGTAERCAWLRGNMPDVYILPERPSCRSDTNGTDKYEYAWCWWRGAGRTEGTVRVLAATPITERKCG